MLELTRRRPHWHMLVFHYLFGCVLAWQLIEDIILGQGRIYSGEFFPWRQEANLVAPLGTNAYIFLAGAEIVLLAMYFFRVRLRLTILLLAAVMFVDNLGSFLNHRTLMIIQLVALSMCPLASNARESGYRGKSRYFSLDLIRWQILVVYVTTAIHKCNPQFLSGETMRNIFWMVEQHGMKSYPEWLLPMLRSPELCLALGLSSVALEFALPIGLNFRRLAGWCMATAVIFHLGISLLMPFIWIFTTQIAVTLIAFLPDRLPERATYRLIRRDPRSGPRRLLRLTWAGYLTEGVESALPRAWCLVMPDGERLHGTSAWIELMALSPVTMLPAEMLRAVTFQAERSYAEPEPSDAGEREAAVGHSGVASLANSAASS